MNDKIIILILLLTTFVFLSSTISLGLSSELYYDDGNFESSSTYSVGRGVAVRFTPRAYPFNLTQIRYGLIQNPNSTFEVHVWDDNGSEGKPGNNLITPFNTTPTVGIPHWHNVTLPSHCTITSGDFYAGLIFQVALEPAIGDDTSRPDNRSYYYDTVSWTLESNHDYGIRVLGEYTNLTSFTVELQQGWNLVSIPLELV